MPLFIHAGNFLLFSKSGGDQAFSTGSHPFSYTRKTIGGKTILSRKFWLCAVCASQQNAHLFQEVLEKNLTLTQGMVKNGDDAESLDNDSTMSTSSNMEPFANDDLGIVTHTYTPFD